MVTGCPGDSEAAQQQLLPHGLAHAEGRPELEADADVVGQLGAHAAGDHAQAEGDHARDHQETAEAREDSADEAALELSAQERARADAAVADQHDGQQGEAPHQLHDEHAEARARQLHEVVEVELHARQEVFLAPCRPLHHGGQVAVQRELTEEGDTHGGQHEHAAEGDLLGPVGVALGEFEAAQVLHGDTTSVGVEDTSTIHATYAVWCEIFLVAGPRPPVSARASHPADAIGDDGGRLQAGQLPRVDLARDQLDGALEHALPAGAEVGDVREGHAVALHARLLGT